MTNWIDMCKPAILVGIFKEFPILIVGYGIITNEIKLHMETKFNNSFWGEFGGSTSHERYVFIFLNTNSLATATDKWLYERLK